MKPPLAFKLKIRFANFNKFPPLTNTAANHTFLMKYPIFYAVLQLFYIPLSTTHYYFDFFYSLFLLLFFEQITLGYFSYFPLLNEVKNLIRRNIGKYN